MATVDSDKVVCGGIHAMIVAVLVLLDLQVPDVKYPFHTLRISTIDMFAGGVGSFHCRS
jgi:hypothetical protein